MASSSESMADNIDECEKKLTPSRLLGVLIERLWYFTKK